MEKTKCFLFINTVINTSDQNYQNEKIDKMATNITSTKYCK